MFLCGLAYIKHFFKSMKETLFLIKLQVFYTNGSGGICCYLQAVTEPVLVKIHSYKWHSYGVCDGVSLYLHPVVVCFSKASGPCYKWQWWSLWRNLFSSPCCDYMFIVKLQVFIINGGDGVYDGTCFYLHAVSVCF